MTGQGRIAAAGCPAITADQMREVDRAVIEDFHIDLVQMMENAGRGLADLAVDLFSPQRVIVLAGAGGNGGGGLVAARHLANRGRHVQVVLAVPADQFRAVPDTSSTSSPGWTSRSPPAPTHRSRTAGPGRI